MTTPEGDVEQSVAAFANSWKTKEVCQDASIDLEPIHPCELNGHKKAETERQCAKIKDTVFERKNPSHYFLYPICLGTGNRLIFCRLFQPVTRSSIPSLFIEIACTTCARVRWNWASASARPSPLTPKSARRREFSSTGFPKCENAVIFSLIGYLR